MTEGSDPEALRDTLTLADWRRRVATLYADVRRIAATDPAAALAHWRFTREELFRTHPQSPVPAERRATFVADHFEHDPSLRFEVTVEPPAVDAARGQASLSTTVGPIDFGGVGAGLAGAAAVLPVSGPGRATMAFQRFASVDVPFPDGARRLEVFWMEGYAGGLFLPFRDSTNGNETYGAGRYLLDGAKSADLGGDPERGTLILDFNFAFQPSCAWDPRFACPLSPPSNRLDLEVRAGERLA